MPIRSKIEPGRRPEIVPTSRPPASHSTDAPTASPRLTGIASQMSELTWVCSLNE
jgi:hypothetical protein